MRPRPFRDQRGQALSSFVAVVVAALLLVAGLVVDGGAKVSAARTAQAAASAAARAGVDAGATSRAAGARVDVGAVTAAARGVLAERGAAGTVAVVGGRVTVEARVSTPTVFLGLIGISRLDAAGSASSELRASR